MNQYDLIVVLGPTASGKTSFAARLAYELDGEVISADSRQVYRQMDIGTGKDYADYQVEGSRVPYHLVDILEPGERYHVYAFQQDFLKVYRDIHQRHRMPVLCGGTGLYIESVLKGYRLLHVPPEPGLRKELARKSLEELQQMLFSFNLNLHNTTDLTTHKRIIRAIEIARYYASHPEEDIEYPRIRPFIFGIRYDRPAQRRMITKRLKDRLESGLVEEVMHLMDKGLTRPDLEYYGLEYRYVVRYLEGELDYEQMFSQLNTAIHQFAKRQMTWFRRMQRNGFVIQWLDGHMSMDQKLERARQLLSGD
ncbi:MAG: tRNA (adenosine(37)-N6)-dimethylallyltransferase MiaA [Bacteroidales bacterium]|nr:tRNA (adenosine(37)-N6)-dimethylallyltransferase MiaA [Bacteroidales bacterium]